MESTRISAWLLLAALARPGEAAGPLQAQGPETESRSWPNLALPTLGGRQLWADVEWRAGWRIQRHVWMGHHRLLDEHDVRRAWGSLEACRCELDERVPHPSPAPRLVVLVHGLGRTRKCWNAMRSALEAEGYDVLDLAYPSTRASIEEHAERLAQLLDRLQGAREVSFVTHSLGGIVVRALLARDDPWRERIAIGGIVMLAPPNQGARAAAFASRWNLLDRLLGPSLEELLPARPAALPVPSVPVLVLRGECLPGIGWNPWLAGADDGVVTAEETGLPGARIRVIAPCTHTFLPCNREAVAATARFLAER